jgi:hypothetical protein
MLMKDDEVMPYRYGNHEHDIVTPKVSNNLIKNLQVRKKSGKADTVPTAQAFTSSHVVHKVK